MASYKRDLLSGDQAATAEGSSKKIPPPERTATFNDYVVSISFPQGIECSLTI